MVSLLQSGIIIVALLIVVNGAMDGAVQDSAYELMTSDEKKEFRNSLYCIGGLMLWPPTKEIAGIDFPVPSFDDLIITAVFAGMILVVLTLLNTKHTWKHAVLIYVAVWFAVKFSGLFLIKLSGQDCELLMADMAGMMNGAYTLSALLGVGAFYKVARVLKSA